MKIKRLIAVAMAMVMAFSCTAFGAENRVYFDFPDNDIGLVYTDDKFYNINVYVDSKDAADKELTVTVDNPSVVEVYEKKLKADRSGKAVVSVRGKKVGEFADITVKSKTGLSDTLKVGVGPEDRFELKEDTWPIRNHFQSFGYATQQEYKMPFNTFKKLFGEHAKIAYINFLDVEVDETDEELTREDIKQKEEEKKERLEQLTEEQLKELEQPLWGGNCLGLSVTAILDYLGYIDIPVRGDLSEKGYEGIFPTYGPYLNKDSELTKLIEYYQCMQYDSDFEGWLMENDLSTEELYDIAHCRETPVLFIIKMGSLRHAMVLDCADSSWVKYMDPDSEDTWYRVHVYDPNHPYQLQAKSGVLQNIGKTYNERYFYFKKSDAKWGIFKEWKYNLGMDNGDDIKDEGEIWIGNDENTEFFEERPLLNLIRLDTKEMEKFFSEMKPASLSKNKDFFILNLWAKTVEVIDKATSKKVVDISIAGSEGDVTDERWKLFSPIGISNGNDKPFYTASGPLGNYKVTLAEGTAMVRCNDNLNIIKTDGQATFTINEENDTLSITADNDSNVKVIQQNIFDPDSYTAVTLEGDMKAGQTVDVSLDDSDNFSVAASEGVMMDIEVESTKSKNKTFVAEDVVLGDADYALQDVLSGKTEVTSQPVETPAVQPSQPDTSDDDKPAVKKDTATASSWAKSTLDLAYEAGIVPALTDDPAFKAAITREQFAELAVAMVSAVCGKPELTGEKTFTDCSNPAVLLAAEMGIVSGVGNGKFDPKTTTNREQIAAMVDRAINYINEQKGIDLTPSASDISKFADKDKVSGWAKESVGTLAANGIMSGTSATTLSPKDSCTVEQSIMLLYRVYEAAK